MNLIMVYTPTYVQDPDSGEDIEIHTCDKDKLSDLYDRLPDNSRDKETLDAFSNGLGSTGDPWCHVPTTYGFVCMNKQGSSMKMEELEPKGNLVAPESLEGIDKRG